MTVKDALKRIFVSFIVATLLTMSIFVCFNRPKPVKAEVITAVALGAGALAALVASYFAASGIQVTNNGASESYVQSWYNGIVNRYRASSDQAEAVWNAYFNANQEYIGDPDALSFLLTDTGKIGYWQISKGLTQGLESLKEWFVSTFNLSGSSDPVVLDNMTVYVDPVLGASYPIYNTYDINRLNNYDRLQVWETIDSIWSSTDIGSSLTIYKDANNFWSITLDDVSSQNQSLYTIVYFHGLNDITYEKISTNWVQQTAYKFMLNYYNSSFTTLGLAYFGKGVNGTMTTTNALERVFDFSANTSDISLDGALTEGYQDFQDALDQDLANEQDNDDAVVQVGVGALDGVLTGDEATDKIMEMAATNTLEGTYEGVYENEQEATDSKEDEKDFVPEVPVGWVTVDGLEDFFPFCIPFDLYALIDYFDAEPVAPVIRWPMSFGGVFETQEVVLDFSDWEAAASIFRVIVVIGFLIFLIIKTRDLIRG